MILYHATYKYYKQNILDKGLLLPKYTGNDNWGMSENYIYASNDIENAISFVECADEVDKAIYDSGIIVFSFDSNNLDRENIKLDDNNTDNFIDVGEDEGTIFTVQISQNIPTQYLSIVYED